MTYLLVMDKMEETRDRILEAAEELFAHYGFAKTTMAEIAGKCDMSAANIYRFFEKKEDIVAEMAGRYFRTVEASLREVVKRPGLTATQRLEAFVVALLSQSHNLSCCNEKMSEAVSYIMQRQRALVDRHQDVLRSQVAEILAEGNRSGEFDVEDVVETAGVVLDATFIYQAPGCAVSFTLEELERSAVRMVRTLVGGLRRR